MKCPHCGKEISAAELASFLRSIKSSKRSETSRINGTKGGRGYLAIIKVTADNGASQVYSREDLGLPTDRGYTRKEWREALQKAGYYLSGKEQIN